MKLYQGDCLEIIGGLPDKSIDMILSDPPYGMGYKSNYRTQSHKAIANDKSLDWLDPFFALAYDKAKDNTAHYIFCSWHNVDLFKQAAERNNFKVCDLIVWEKNNTGMGDLKGTFAPKCEFILHIKKGKRHIEGTRDPNIIRYPRTDNKLHPTQKPVGLCEYLISKFSKQGETILDPFMGSGTSGIAALNMGRDFIGIELDSDYYAIAERRINEAKTAKLFT